MRHFVTLIEICMHLIRVNPGHRVKRVNKEMQRVNSLPLSPVSLYAKKSCKTL